MKIIKLFLSICVILVVMLIGMIVYQNQILHRLLKTDTSEFKNVQYKIENSELSFDDFVLNGKSLGRGKATISFTFGGFLGIIPGVEIDKLTLSEVNVDSIYSEKNIYVDSFINKIKEFNLSNNNEQNTDKLEETHIFEDIDKSIKNTENEVSNFIDDYLVENIDSINILKENYKIESNYRNKANQVNQITSKAKEISKKIDDVITKIEEETKKIEEGKYSEGNVLEKKLNELAYLVELNSIDNINDYIFIDNYSVIEDSLNKTLKVIELVKEIQSVPIVIKNLYITANDLEITALNNSGESKGHFNINTDGKNVLVSLNFDNENINLNYRVNDLSVNLNKKNDSSITTLLNYEKSNFIDLGAINLISEISYYDNNILKINKTQLNNEEINAITNKINNIEQNEIISINQDYEQSLFNLEEINEKFNQIIDNLNKIKNDLFILNNSSNYNNLIKSLREMISSTSAQNLQDDESQEELTNNLEENSEKDNQD